MAKFTVYVLDTETTGLDPVKNDIIEISILRLGDKQQQKTWWMKPINLDNIDDGALKVNGVSKDDLLWKTASGKEKYKVVDEVLPEIENWVAEDGANIYTRLIVGHNINFDHQMMMSTWNKAGASETYPFSKFGNMIDTKGLTLFFDWIAGENNGKYSLGACIKKYGLEMRKAHGAEDDTKMCADLLLRHAEIVKKS